MVTKIFWRLGQDDRTIFKVSIAVTLRQINDSMFWLRYHKLIIELYVTI